MLLNFSSIALGTSSDFLDLAIALGEVNKVRRWARDGLRGV